MTNTATEEERPSKQQQCQSYEIGSDEGKCASSIDLYLYPCIIDSTIKQTVDDQSSISLEGTAQSRVIHRIGILLSRCDGCELRGTVFAD